MTPRTGPGSSPPQGRDFAEFVRLALHTAADQVEPRADGLAPIRARILAGAGWRDRQPKAGRRRPGRGRGAYRRGPGTGAQRP